MDIYEEIRIKKLITMARSLLTWCLEPDKKLIYKQNIDDIERYFELDKGEKTLGGEMK